MQRISENQFVGSTWMPNFYGYDGHGSARFLTNSAGAVTDSYDYDAFGMPIRTSGTTPNVFLYDCLIGQRISDPFAIHLLLSDCFSCTSLPSVALHVVEFLRFCADSIPSALTIPFKRLRVTSGNHRTLAVGENVGPSSHCCAPSIPWCSRGRDARRIASKAIY